MLWVFYQFSFHCQLSALEAISYLLIGKPIIHWDLSIKRKKVRIDAKSRWTCIKLRNFNTFFEHKTIFIQSYLLKQPLFGRVYECFFVFVEPIQWTHFLCFNLFDYNDGCEILSRWPRSMWGAGPALSWCNKVQCEKVSCSSSGSRSELSLQSLLQATAGPASNKEPGTDCSTAVCSGEHVLRRCQGAWEQA